MPPFFSKDENSDWLKATYPFAGASLDKSLPPHQCSGPFLLSGVDGREWGSVIRWPGFIRTTIGDVPIAGDPAPKYIMRMDLNKGSEGHELHGFVILRRHVIFSYYDTELRAWYAKILRYNFGGLQLNSDSFRASGSNVALYLSWCGQTTGNGTSAAGQRHLRVTSGDFFKPGDTIWIERDTARAEEAVIDSYTGTEYPEGDDVDYDILLRTNLKYAHGASGTTYQIEGGSGNVGMTVVTHDGDGFLIEQGGPLYEDGDVDFEVNMIGGTTTPAPTTTTTTEDFSTGTPVINQTYAGDTHLTGTIASGDATGPTGVEIKTEHDHGSGWTSFSWGLGVAGEGSTIYSNADSTWSRQAYKNRDDTDDSTKWSIKEGRIYRIKTRVADVGDGTPGPWTYSDPVTTLSAPPGAVPALATIHGDLVAKQDEMAISFPGETPASGAQAQVMLKSQTGDNWTGFTSLVSVTPGLNAISVAPLQEGRTYSVRHRNSSSGEWSGESSGDDGRLLSISQEASKEYSALASINEPVTQGDAKIEGFLGYNGTSATRAQVVKWNGERWIAVTILKTTGQYGAATFSITLPSSVVTGEIVSVRTRQTADGEWSGDVSGDDMDENNRLMTIAVTVQ